MTLNKMAIYAVRQAEGLFEVDAISDFQTPECGALYGFRYHINRKGPGIVGDNGQAGPVDGNAGPDFRLARDTIRRHGKGHAAVMPAHGLNKTDGFDDTGEHGNSLWIADCGLRIADCVVGRVACEQEVLAQLFNFGVSELYGL